MKLIYGRKGDPAGSVDGDAIYNRDGEQIGFLDGEYLYAAADGQWLGSFVEGIVYNGFDDPEGFTSACQMSTPPPLPTIRSMVPPKLKSLGRNVRAEPSRPIPDFLSHMSSIPARPDWAGFLL